MAIDTPTQSGPGNATEGSETRTEIGAGAPTDAPTAEEAVPLARVRAIAAKEKREGERSGRKALLEAYGIETEDELAQLVDVGRKAAPKKVSDVDRVTEKLTAESAKREQALAAQVAQLQAERDSALIRSEAQTALANAGLVDGAADLVLGALGIGAQPESRVVVKGGAVTVVDRDGDPTGKTVSQYLLEFVKSRTYLQQPSVQLAKAKGANGQAPQAPKKSLQAMNYQEQMQELIRQAQAARVPGQ